MFSDDGEKVMAQNRGEEVCHITSSTVSIAEGGKSDKSLDENSTSAKKHSLSMDVRTFIFYLRVQLSVLLSICYMRSFINPFLNPLCI